MVWREPNLPKVQYRSLQMGLHYYREWNGQLTCCSSVEPCPVLLIMHQATNIICPDSRIHDGRQRKKRNLSTSADLNGMIYLQALIPNEIASRVYALRQKSASHLEEIVFSTL